MAGEVEIKVGLSNADKQQMKNEMITAVVSALSSKFDPVVGDGEYIGVRFYDGDTSGVLVGNAVGLTPSSFSDTDGYTRGTIEDVFPFNAITKEERFCYYKASGNQILDTNGNPLKEVFVKFPQIYFRGWRGRDTNLNKDFVEYDIKSTPDEAHGFYKLDVNRDTVSGAYKTYAKLSRYNLAPVTTSTNTTVYLAVTGYRYADEINPTSIDNGRALGNTHLVLEFSLLQLLHYICFADRSYGWGGTNGVSPFTGCSKDVYGYTIPVADDVNKTFSILNSNVLSGLKVGMKVAFLTNQYASGRYAQVTITSKTVGDTYTVFGYADNVTGLQGKLACCVYKVDNGICDDISALNGVNMEYPEGHRPFVEFYIENPYGIRTWLDGVCYLNGVLRTRNLGDSSQLIDSRGTWENMGMPAIPSGWAGYLDNLSRFRETNGYPKYHGFLINGLVNGSSSSGCVSDNKFESGDYAVFVGRNRETYGGISSVASCSGNTWSNLASSYLNHGCWGRVYRSARHED